MSRICGFSSECFSKDFLLCGAMSFLAKELKELVKHKPHGYKLLKVSCYTIIEQMTATSLLQCRCPFLMLASIY